MTSKIYFTIFLVVLFYSKAIGQCPAYNFQPEHSKLIEWDSLPDSIIKKIESYCYHKLGKLYKELLTFESCVKINTANMSADEYVEFKRNFATSNLPKYFFGFRYTDSTTGFYFHCLSFSMDESGKIINTMQIPNFRKYPLLRSIKITNVEAMNIAQHSVKKGKMTNIDASDFSEPIIRYYPNTGRFVWILERQLNSEKYQRLIIDAITGEIVKKEFFSDI